MRAKEVLFVIRKINAEFEEEKSDFNSHGLVFYMEEGHPFEAKVLEDGFQKILAELHLKSVNIHATSHTFATEALQKATGIITVSEILGHTKPSTTLDMYGHTFDDRKRALMAQM